MIQCRYPSAAPTQKQLSYLHALYDRYYQRPPKVRTRVQAAREIQRALAGNLRNTPVIPWDDGFVVELVTQRELRGGRWQPISKETRRKLRD